MYVDDLPAIWAPVQWEQSPEERVDSIHEQATASLLWTMDAPEAVLRLLLAETEIQRLGAPPEGYDPREQGDWDAKILTFGPYRPIRLHALERSRDHLRVVYDFGDLGYWEFTIEAQRVTIERM
jgi:hypothetical protein